MHRPTTAPLFFLNRRQVSWSMLRRLYCRSGAAEAAWDVVVFAI